MSEQSKLEVTYQGQVVEMDLDDPRLAYPRARAAAEGITVPQWFAYVHELRDAHTEAELATVRERLAAVKRGEDS